MRSDGSGLDGTLKRLSHGLLWPDLLAFRELALAATLHMLEGEVRLVLEDLGAKAEAPPPLGLSGAPVALGVGVGAHGGPARGKAREKRKNARREKRKNAPKLKRSPLCADARETAAARSQGTGSGRGHAREETREATGTLPDPPAQS